MDVLDLRVYPFNDGSMNPSINNSVAKWKILLTAEQFDGVKIIVDNATTSFRFLH